MNMSRLRACFYILNNYLKIGLLSISPNLYYSLSGLETALDGDNLITTEYDDRVKSGFRLDFVLYSSVAIFLGYYYILKGVKDKFYIKLLNTYIIANIVWVFLIYAAYTNRTAYLSWFIMPVVIIYPLLKYPILKHQNQFIAYLILGSFGFTILLYLR